MTVTKCQAALRTLQGFPYFSPTCLCKEPSRDPECNQIREFLFDHPCGIVSTKGKKFFFIILSTVIYGQARHSRKRAERFSETTSLAPFSSYLYIVFEFFKNSKKSGCTGCPIWMGDHFVALLWKCFSHLRNFVGAILHEK